MCLSWEGIHSVPSFNDPGKDRTIIGIGMSVLICGIACISTVVSISFTSIFPAYLSSIWLFAL